MKTEYPKTLVMRNSPSGLIWQSYNVLNEQEQRILTSNAQRNGFIVQVESYGYTEESFPGWRDTIEWKKCLEKDECKDIK